MSIFTIALCVDPFLGKAEKVSLPEEWMILSKYKRLLEMLIYGIEENIKNVYGNHNGRNDTSTWQHVVFKEKENEERSVSFTEHDEGQKGTIDLQWLPVAGRMMPLGL